MNRSEKIKFFPTLPCCSLGKSIRARLGSFYHNADYAKDYYERKPNWTVDIWVPEENRNVIAKINFCPFCGKKVPDFKANENCPDKVMIVTDGGLTCDTCKNIVMECTCAPSECLWVIDEETTE